MTISIAALSYLVIAATVVAALSPVLLLGLWLIDLLKGRLW